MSTTRACFVLLSALGLLAFSTSALAAPGEVIPQYPVCDNYPLPCDEPPPPPPEPAPDPCANGACDHPEPPLPPPPPVPEPLPPPPAPVEGPIHYPPLYPQVSGCVNESDPMTGEWYICAPSGSLYTPDWQDPARYRYEGSACNPYNGDGRCSKSELNYPVDTAGIPPPAWYNDRLNYISSPEWVPSPIRIYERVWNFAAYRHDSCYGSQLGRTYCDVNFWRDMSGLCKAHYPPWRYDRYLCIGMARSWYFAVGAAGESHYIPRISILQPTGPRW